MLHINIWTSQHTHNKFFNILNYSSQNKSCHTLSGIIHLIDNMLMLTSVKITAWNIQGTILFDKYIRQEKLFWNNSHFPQLFKIYYCCMALLEWNKMHILEIIFQMYNTMIKRAWTFFIKSWPKALLLGYKWGRAKANRVSPREHTDHSKHHLPTTQETTLHMDITRWSTPKSDWSHSLHLKMEKLYRVSKNKTGSWLWLRSWTPYCQIHLNWRIWENH